MKREFLLIVILLILTIAVFGTSFATFFAQDDFVLIQEFSGGTLTQDMANVLGPAKVTHWRPLHNLYFFIVGNLFNKNFVAYHVATFIIHILTAYLIYKIAFRFSKNFMPSAFSCLVYAMHPAFFISLFWVSGGATTIGFFLFALSFYFYLIRKPKISMFLYFLSMLASEAMLLGIIIFVAYRFFINNKKSNDNFWQRVTIVALVFIVLRFLLFKSESVARDYQIKVGIDNISAVKYYILRIFAFPDTAFNLIWLLLLIFWLIVLIYLFRSLTIGRDFKEIKFYLLIIFAGLFPFILLPDHLSAHYVNISIFGFSLLLGYILGKIKPIVLVSILVIFGLLSAASVNSMIVNSWVVNRSRIAKAHISSIENLDHPGNSMIVFGDDNISSSYEAYISLGTGKALDFWFADKHYRSCFSAFEICEARP